MTLFNGIIHMLRYQEKNIEFRSPPSPTLDMSFIKKYKDAILEHIGMGILFPSHPLSADRVRC